MASTFVRRFPLLQVRDAHLFLYSTIVQSPPIVLQHHHMKRTQKNDGKDELLVYVMSVYIIHSNSTEELQVETVYFLAHKTSKSASLMHKDTPSETFWAHGSPEITRARKSFLNPSGPPARYSRTLCGEDTVIIQSFCTPHGPVVPHSLYLIQYEYSGCIAGIYIIARGSKEACLVVCSSYRRHFSTSPYQTWQGGANTSKNNVLLLCWNLWTTM